MTKAECLANVRCALLKQQDAKAGRMAWCYEGGSRLRGLQAHYNRSRPYVSLDHANNNITEEELIQHLGGWSTDRVPLPRYSPDVHQVVEHFIGRLKQQFWQLVSAEARYQQSPATLQQAMRVAFYNMPAAPIERDCETLPATWRVIAAEKGAKVWIRGQLYDGTGGDWPVRALR